jgi:hypothetical protein
MGLWFWCVPRRGDLRAVRDVFMPRHTPYEEASRPTRACDEKTRRVCEPGRGALDGGVVNSALRTHQGLVSGWGLGFGVFRGGVFLRAVRGVIGPRHTPYEEARQGLFDCSAGYFPAKRRRTSMPRSIVASGAANEIRK